MPLLTMCGTACATSASDPNGASTVDDARPLAPYASYIGVSAIFGPGTNIPDAARKVLALIRAREKAAA